MKKAFSPSPSSALAAACAGPRVRSVEEAVVTSCEGVTDGTVCGDECFGRRDLSPRRLHRHDVRGGGHGLRERRRLQLGRHLRRRRGRASPARR